MRPDPPSPVARAGDAGDALATFVHEAVRRSGEHRGLVDALGRRPSGAEVRTHLRERAVEIVAPLGARAHSDRALRHDLDALDLLLVLRALTVVAAAPEVTAERAHRHVELALRGLRPGRAPLSPA